MEEAICLLWRYIITLCFFIWQVVCEYDWQFDEFEVHFAVFMFPFLLSWVYFINCMHQHFQDLS
jgi:hypothetical protein